MVLESNNLFKEQTRFLDEDGYAGIIERDLALSTNITWSSSQNRTGVDINMLDYDSTTYAGFSWTGSSASDSLWVKFDLGTVKNILTTHVNHSNDGENGNNNEIHIETSDDNTNWTQRKFYSVRDALTNFDFSFGKVRYRYLRIRYEVITSTAIILNVYNVRIIK